MNSNKTIWIGGFHAVIASIKNKKRTVREIIATEPIKELNDLNLKYKIVEKKKIKKIFENTDFQFQNIAAKIEIFPKIDLEKELKNQLISNLIILDGVNDPRNIGSIIRSAVAFNIDAIILKEKDYPSTSPSMYKTASGAMEFIKIIEVTNLNNIIPILKKNNFWIFGLDHKAKNNFQIKDLSKKNAYIFGSEGDGMSKKLSEKCDYLIKLETSVRMRSLNVSNAVSAVLSLVNYHNINLAD